MTTSADVPGRLPCAIDGHAYLCEADYERTTVDVIRQQSDASSEPGEQSLSPYGLWRRSQESWHHGAGQEFLDGRSEKAADPHRFRSSKGIDPWTRGQVSLLHPTMKGLSSSNANLFLAVAQAGTGISYLYASDGTELYHSTIPFNLSNTLALQNGTGWTPTNATIAAQSYYFRLTGTAAAAISATGPTGTSGYPVDAGRAYGAAFYSTYGGGGSARTPSLSINWYTAAGAPISSTAPVAAGSDDTTLATVVIQGTAPATAARASLTVDYGGGAVGEIHNAINVAFAPYDIVPTNIGSASMWVDAVINAGQAAQSVQSIASNGSYVWAALGTSGLHRTAAAAGSSTADVPAAPGGGQISLVGFANGFLLAAGSLTSTTGKNTLWLVSDPLGTPTLGVAPLYLPIKTHDNPSFVWTGIAPGRNCVYAFGNSGGNGEVYKILFDPLTGSLSPAASFATYLPDGETIHALTFYAGGIIMGTGKGVRLGQASGDGNIDYGPLIPTLWPVRCLEPQDRYCWFGWTKYDATNSGLGRVDLGYFTDTLTPAWASDLMTIDTSTGDVVATVTFAPYGYTANQRPPVRVFTVAGEGVYIEDPGSRQAIGTLETGTIRYNTSEPKAMRAGEVRHHALPASSVVSVNLMRDDNPAFTLLIGVSSVTDSYGTTLNAGANAIGEAFEVRLAFDRPDDGGADYTRTPELTRWTLKALPLPSTIDETFTLNLLMDAQIETNEGESIPLDVPVEVAFIKTLEQTRRIIEFQVGSDTFTGYVLKSQFKGTNWVSPARQYSEGVMQVQLMTVRG